MNAALKLYERTAQQSRDQLILDNIDYVARILSTMTIKANSQDARENLRSAGLVGLVEAANAFDSDSGTAFRTFAYPRIRGAILDELRKQAPVSQQLLQRIGVLRKAHESLQHPITPEMLADATSLSVEEVVEGLEAMRFTTPENWNDLSGIVHGSWRESSTSAEGALEEQEMRQVLADAIEQLPEQERLVLTLYFSEELNLVEIGAVIDRSESRVSRILASAKYRLQEFVKCKIA